MREVTLDPTPASFGAEVNPPVLLYDTGCQGSQAYIRLAAEVMRRERQPTPAVAAE